MPTKGKTAATNSAATKTEKSDKTNEKAVKTEKISAEKTTAAKTEKTIKAVKTERVENAEKSAKTDVAVKKPVEKKAKKTVQTRKTKVLFVTTEAIPFASTGGMGEVCGSLPRAIEKDGAADARIMLPLYEEVAVRYKDSMTFVCNITVALSWRNQYCGLFKLVHEGMTYYFVDNEYYFKRPNLYGYYDDAERFAFFSKAALELIPYLDFNPDIIQSNDHLTALVPIYYALEYKQKKGYDHIKNVFTVHNINYQGTYPLVIAGDVFGIKEEDVPVIEYGGCINLVKGAILSCDMITAMSPQYAKEIRLPEFSCGLDEILIQNRDKIVGILNGIDTDECDPAASPSLFENYDVNTLDKKSENKIALQRMFNLPEDRDIPMVCMIAHMVPYKGYDLLRRSINKSGVEGNILDTNIQLVILGTGDTDIESFLTHVQRLYPRRVLSLISYNKDLALKVLAAADMCLVPSRVEPCGLTQMKACRFGAVPIVRATGGLIDSITDCENEDGNGFVFEEYDSDVMDAAITRAVTMYYYHKDEWTKLQRRCMNSDFAWSNSARKFGELYKKIIG